MTDPAKIFDDIRSISRDFRRQLRKGAARPIEDYLDRIHESARDNLFQQLLSADIEFRRQKGESPTSVEYKQRFPQYTAQIRQAFFEPSLISNDGSHDESSTNVPTIITEIAAGEHLGDYELLQELGRGGMGVVHEARHSKTGNRVALKTLPTSVDGQQIDANKLYRFRREFRSLSEVNHPNLVGMQTLEIDDGQWFFTMDLIEGEDFLSYVRPDGKLDESRLRGCLPQLVSAVMALHRRGIIHRDLKPSNVLVSHDGRVSVLDFGLVAELQKTADMTQTRSGTFAGTPLYAAPEQMFGERTEASDWYAFGTMLYESLTGAPPFKGKNQMEILRRKQQEDPPTLADRDELPSDLAELVDGLILREPIARLNAEAISQRLQMDDETRTHGSTRGSKGSHGSSGSADDETIDLDVFPEEEIVLIGREKQLAQLEESRQELIRTRTPMVVWITGLSGEGKSSLAEKFLRPYRGGSEMLVLSGRCYDRESVPFKAIDSIIDPLVRYLRSFSEDHLDQILPADIVMLAHLFPLLNRVRSIEERMNKQILTVDSRQIRYRAFEALRELLVSIGERHPVALLIDDLQWGDADSASAIHALLFGNAPPTVLFLGTYRRDEMDESSFHRQWSQLDREKETSAAQCEIALNPLDQEQCIALVTARAGVSEETARDVVGGLFENTRGNPYFLEQMIEGFNAGATDWRPMPLKEIIAEKFSRLPDGSEELLKDVAIAGKAIQANQLAAISESGRTVLSLLTHMRSERLVRLVGSGEGQLVDTWHDKIRETTLDRMDPDARRATHLRFADWIESSEGLSVPVVESYLSQPFTTQSVPEFSIARVHDLAYHFHLAGDRRAFYYQFLAGELAFQNYASEEAIEYLTRTSELLQGDEPDRWRARLWHRLATSSHRVMDFSKSIEQFEQGIRFTEPGLERAFFQAGIATVHQTQTSYEAAAHFHDLALAEIGRKRPKGLSSYFTAGVNFMRLAVTPAPWLRRRSGGPTAEESLEQEICVDAVAYLFDRFIPIIEYPAAVMRLGILSHRSDAAGFASGVGMVAAHMGLSGFPQLGRRLARRAIARIGATVDSEAEGICRSMSASALSYSADFEEADQEFHLAIPLLVKCGSHIHGATALHMMRHLCEAARSGSAELDAARQLVSLASNSGDMRSLCWGHYDHAGSLARIGMVYESFQAIENAHEVWERRDLNLTTPIYLATRGFVFLQASEYDMTRDIADRSWRTAIRHLRVMDVCLRGLAWYLECVAGPQWATDPTGFDRRLVRRRCRWARLLALLHVKIRPHLWRARGRAFTALGKTRKGIRNFERAVNSAKQFGMKYDLAKSLLDLAAVKEEGREENRREAIRLLKEMESVIPRAESWLLGDHYDEAVVAPEFDLEAWEREHGSVSMTPEGGP
jgi:eukaryotic-like serine/threonine-protein kinase